MIYFDNAATTYPKPACVLRAVESAVTRYGGNPGRGGHDMAMRTAEKLYDIRRRAAEFFRAEPQNVVFTQNCTMSLNIAIKGVMRPGGHIILSDLEHNAVVRPLYKMKQDGLLDYDIAKVYEDCDERTVRSFEDKIRGDTRAIVCTHASNVTGAVLPIKKLGALCKKRGLVFIVDAAQSAGVLPIDMREANIQLLCMPGHKGLYGISGSGLLLLNGAPVLDTLLEGGTGSLSAQLAAPDFPPDRFEAGTVGVPGILSIGAGLCFLRSVGRDRVYRHEFRLCRQVWEELAHTEGVRLYSGSCVPGRTAPIVSFNLRGKSSEQLAGELNRRGFALRGGLHCAPLAHEHYGTKDCGMVRFSPSVFSREWEAERLVQNVRAIARDCGR